MRKQIVAATGAAVMLLSLAQSAFADVGVRVNGSEVDFSPAPIIEAGRVFVPLRGVFERLGASVVYSDGEINATGNGRDISLHIGATQATVNGQDEILDVAPFIVGDSTYVPLRFVSEALGASVNYDDSDQVVSITMAGAPQAYVPQAATNADNDGSYASYAPPPIPSYAQPYVPQQNEIWQPGYWAWGPYGYYWVPGTWVDAPQAGYLWTPGYWRVDNSRYAWSSGFWALAVGFYGGVNYGSGYYGHGYDGGRWNGNTFNYNTYVTRVNTTIVHNVYIDRTVIVNHDTTRVSYNGGANGVQARPSAQEQVVARSKHLSVTTAQVQHVRVAEQDRRLLATVNHNQPLVVVVPRPLTKANPPVGFEAVRPVPPPVKHGITPGKPTHMAPIEPVRPAERLAPPPTERMTPAPFARPLPLLNAPPRIRTIPATRPVMRPLPIPQAAPIVPTRPIVRPAHIIPPPPHVNAVRPIVRPAMHAPAPQRPATPAEPREDTRPDNRR